MPTKAVIVIDVKREFEQTQDEWHMHLRGSMQSPIDRSIDRWLAADGARTAIARGDRAHRGPDTRRGHRKFPIARRSVYPPARRSIDMTIPLWCLIPAVFLPYIWGTTATVIRQKQFGKADNKNPRIQQTQLQGAGARAHAAHLNAFEALAVFTPAVLIAHVVHADPVWSTRLAIGWVIFRVLHGVTYLADVDKARSAFFALGTACAIGLFVLAGMAP
jgi:uncharacterized MAPEG superfamily protein